MMQDPDEDVQAGAAAAAEEGDLRLVPDLAGAAVVDSVGFPAGTVYATVAEGGTGLIRYLDIALEPSGRHVLVPIGHMKIDTEKPAKPLRLRAATLQELEAVPTFSEQQGIPEDLQDDILVAHGRSFYGERYYAHPCFDHSHIFAGDTPIQVGPSTPESVGALTPLSLLEDYEIADDGPDIRGWPLHPEDGPAVGLVRELLVDPAQGKVLYVVVQIDGLAHLTALPIGYIAIHEDRARVRTPALGQDDLVALPAMPEGDFERDDEITLRKSLEERLTGQRRFQRADFCPGVEWHTGDLDK